jgi:hypothetical protein
VLLALDRPHAGTPARLDRFGDLTQCPLEDGAKRARVSPQPNADPPDLDLIGSKYNIAPYWLEDIVMLLRAGASDAEIPAQLRTPDSGAHPTDQTIPLTAEQGVVSLNLRITNQQL